MVRKIFITCLLSLFILPLSSCESLSLDTNSSPPKNIEDCKWKVITSTRIYYTDSYEYIGEDLVLHGFFSYGANDWEWRDEDFTLPKVAYPEAKVVERGGPEDTEIYYFKRGLIFDWESALLHTVKQWEGNSSKDIRFSAEESPWVVNGWYTPTSKISSSFSINIGNTEASKFTGANGLQSIIVEGKGSFTIHIEASGCKWWVKIGVE